MARTSKFVIIVDDDGRYKIPILEILANGFYLHFKDEGFERQIFYSVESLQRYKCDVF